MTLIEKARRNRVAALAMLAPEATNIFAERRVPRRPRPSALPNFLKRGVDEAPIRRVPAAANTPAPAPAPRPAEAQCAA